MDSLFSHFAGKDKFAGRIDRDLIQIFDHALALHIKVAQRVHLIAPELHTQRIFLRERIDIKDPAPDRKFSRRLNLITAHISHLYKLFFQFLQIYRVSDLKFFDCRGKAFWLCHLIHQRVKCGKHCDPGLLGNRF